MLYFLIELHHVILTLSDSNEAGRGHRARRADTNILVVKFNTLTGPSHVHTGDAVVCSNGSCTAILSHISKATDHQDPEKMEKVESVCLSVRLWEEEGGIEV